MHDNGFSTDGGNENLVKILLLKAGREGVCLGAGILFPCRKCLVSFLFSSL